MKEAFADIKQVFPPIPPACDQALMSVLYSVKEKKQAAVYQPARRVMILIAALLAVTCMASAAFYPQIITWFENLYGETYSRWMANGDIAIPNATREATGAVFTLNEVLTRGHGMYVLGTIQPAEGYLLVEYDSSAHDPFGYNTHHGETAPEDTPTIAEKAKETDRRLRYVICRLESIGVDGRAMLTPGSWGYDANVQQDGSIVFTMEIEDNMTVVPGETYTLKLHAQTYGAYSDGSINPDDTSEALWQITVSPKAID